MSDPRKAIPHKTFPLKIHFTKYQEFFLKVPGDIPEPPRDCPDLSICDSRIPNPGYMFKQPYLKTESQVFIKDLLICANPGLS